MLKKNNFLKIFLIIPIVIFRKLSIFLDINSIDIPIAELFLHNLFTGNVNREETQLVLVMFGIVEIILFSLLFGTYIYQDLYRNSVYIFIRQRSRYKWFIKKSVELFIYCFLFAFLFIGSVFLLSVLGSIHKIDILAIKILILTFILVLLFIYLITLLINIVSIRLGSNIGFLVVYLIIGACAFLAITHEKIPFIKNFPVFLLLNPVVAVTINWEGGYEKSLFSIFYFIFLIFITLLIGCLYINKMDISINDNENNK